MDTSTMRQARRDAYLRRDAAETLGDSMALKPTLETLDGLHEEVAKLYTKKDGKYVLEVEDSGFKSALQKERDRADAAEKAIKDREAKEAADKAEAERKKLEEKGEYEKLRAQDQAERERLAKELADERAATQEHLKESAAVAALGAAGLKVNRLLLAELKGSLEVVQGKVLVKGDPSMTPDQKLAKLREDPELAGLFPATASGSGGQAPSGSEKGKSWKEMTLDEQTALYKSNPTQAAALQAGA